MTTPDHHVYAGRDVAMLFDGEYLSTNGDRLTLREVDMYMELFWKLFNSYTFY